MKTEEAAVREWVVGVLAGIYKPKPKEEIWEWAERTLRIPQTENPLLAGQFYQSSLGPYVRELFRWVRTPGKGEFWIMKSSQVGFTMACLILICWKLVHQPGPTLYAIDSLEEARKISKTRLKRWIEDNRLLEEVGESADDLSNLTYSLKAMVVYLIGAHSPGAWKNKTVDLCILDELDSHKYLDGEGSTAELAPERMKRDPNAKLIGFSTPGETDEIRKQWERGTREVIKIPFPCCGQKQELAWERFRFEGAEFEDLAGELDRAKILEEAYFECECCGPAGRLYEHQKNRAMQEYEAVATNPKAPPGVRSLHIWDAYSPFVTFGQLALQYLDAQGNQDKMERFMRGRRGMQFEKGGHQLKHEHLMNLRGAYRRGVCPVEPVAIIQATDIQADIQKSVKVAFDRKGNAWVIDWHRTLVLDEALEWGYEPIPGPGESEWVVDYGWVDEGHRAFDVRRACLRHLPVFWPVKGRGGVQVRQTVGTSDQWVDGEWIKTYHIDDDGFKWQLLAMMRGTRESRKADSKVPRVYFPVDVAETAEGEEFLLETVGEVPEKAKIGRHERWIWKKVGPNDFQDALKYAVACWSVVAPMILPPPGREEAAAAQAV